MIKLLPNSHGAVIGFEITSKISLEEEKEWISKIEQVIAEYGSVSVLVVLDKEAGWGIKAGVEDLKWIMTHMNKLNKVAIVSESYVLKWLVTVDSQFAKLVGIGEKYFESEQIDEAWAWIKSK